MAKTKSKSLKVNAQRADGVFVLKLVLYVILGSLWLKIDNGSSNMQIPVPLGLIIGLFFTTHEHFRIDRKIEYAVLVVAALLGMIAPFGLFISF